jgi:hypothetical protein
MASLREWWQRRQAAKQLAQARQAGVGLYLQEWHLAAQAVPDEDQPTPVEIVLTWCRETLGRCRRPWGIDYFDLSIECTGPGGMPLRTARFSHIRPIQLYQDDAITRQIAAALIGAAVTTGAPVRIAARLFSWGDAAFAALPAGA